MFGLGMFGLGTGSDFDPMPLPRPSVRMAARRASGMSRAEIAEELGTDVFTFCGWEWGRQPEPPFDALYLAFIVRWNGGVR